MGSCLIIKIKSMNKKKINTNLFIGTNFAIDIKKSHHLELAQTPHLLNIINVIIGKVCNEENSNNYYTNQVH